MSNYLDCCHVPFYRNATDLNDFYYNYSIVNSDGSTSYPLRGCDTAPTKIFPFARGDFDCNSTYNVLYNTCNLGPWPSFPPQVFESLGLLAGVTFTYSDTTITAHKTAHGLVVGGEAFTISGQTGVNVALNGSWTVEEIIDADNFTFEINDTPSGDLSPATLDFRDVIASCNMQVGYRGAIGNRQFNGRYGFTDDYVANPKIGTKWLAYHVGIAFEETMSGTCNIYDSITGVLTETFSTQQSNNGSADCRRNLTPWGVEVCVGTSGAGDGNASSSGLYPNCFNIGGPCEIQPLGGVLGVPADPCAHPPEGNYGAPSPEDTRATNKGILQKFCAIDCNLSVVTIPVPWLGTHYNGPISGFLNWLTDHNQDDGLNELCNFVPSLSIWRVTQVSQAQAYTVNNFSVTNTEIEGSISLIITFKNAVYDSIHNEDGTCTKTIKLFDSESQYAYTFTFSATLFSANLFSDLQTDAQGLLAYWNMADDSIWDNRWLQGDCRMLPMVSRREVAGSAPGTGYCEAPTTPDAIWQLEQALAFYDGSVVGAPISTYRDGAGQFYPNAFYDQGWFDWTADIYHYTDNGDGTDRLCYSYGSYMPSDLPSQATQYPEGAKDTSDLGPGWSPFSRFKYNYVLEQFPPFVLGGGAYVAGSNATEVFASKYAEVKMALPSQNFWAPTSVQPNQAAIDNFAGWSATAMRDLNILDGTCTDTGTKRYPDAVPIAGRAAITSISRDSGTGIVTVIHSATPQLRTGDVVDFISDSSAVTASAVTVTVDSDTQFHYTGALPTGAFLVSHGHAGNWQWFDISPKGDFVLSFFKINLNMTQDGGGTWIQNYTSENTAEQLNVTPTGATKAIIAICPPNSPELSDGRWNGTGRTANVSFFYDYPEIEPMDSWRCVIQQGMSDRFWLDAQDNKHKIIPVDGDGNPLPAECASSHQTAPLVEARLTAPIGAPLQFTADSANRWLKMPAQDSFGIGCSGVWGYGIKKLGYTKSLDATQSLNIAGAGDASIGAGDTQGGGL